MADRAHDEVRLIELAFRAGLEGLEPEAANDVRDLDLFLRVRTRMAKMERGEPSAILHDRGEEPARISARERAGDQHGAAGVRRGPHRAGCAEIAEQGLRVFAEDAHQVAIFGSLDASKLERLRGRCNGQDKQGREHRAEAQDRPRSGS
jgi:hypothetical protein